MQSFLNIFLKSKCPLCERSTDKLICMDCDRQVSACKSSQFHQLPSPDLNLFVWGVYDGSLKQAIATLKFKNHSELSQPLGIKIGEVWNQDVFAQNLVKNTQNLPKNLKVVPIPMHPEKLQSRGFNQAELLAQGFCNATRLAIAPSILKRIKNTKPQIDTKSKQEREDNLSSAFEVSQNFNRNLAVLLFDDIYTTGATINEAIATLKSVNIPVLGVVVLAAPKFSKNIVSHKGKDK